MEFLRCGKARSSNRRDEPCLASPARYGTDLDVPGYEHTRVDKGRFKQRGGNPRQVGLGSILLGWTTVEVEPNKDNGIKHRIDEPTTGFGSSRYCSFTGRAAKLYIKQNTVLVYWAIWCDKLTDYIVDLGRYGASAENYRWVEHLRSCQKPGWVYRQIPGKWINAT